jgi:hypothetical protein
MRKTFGPNKDEVTGKWRRLHNEELYNLFSSQNIIRRMKSRRVRWAGPVEVMEDRRVAYSVLVGRPNGKRPRGRNRRRWENIKMDLREIDWDSTDCIALAQDREK